MAQLLSILCIWTSAKVSEFPHLPGGSTDQRSRSHSESVWRTSNQGGACQYASAFDSSRFVSQIGNVNSLLLAILDHSILDRMILTPLFHLCVKVVEFALSLRKALSKRALPNGKYFARPVWSIRSFLNREDGFIITPNYWRIPCQSPMFLGHHLASFIRSRALLFLFWLGFGPDSMKTPCTDAS